MKRKNLSKQIKRDTSDYNKLKQKLKGVELQIKKHSKIMREKQKIKKQIDEKTKKLRKIKQKMSLKSSKKPKLPKTKKLKNR